MVKDLQVIKESRCFDILSQVYENKTFSNSGMITLPKQWRLRFGLIPGRLAELIYQNDSIYIKPAGKNTTNNKRYISEKGTVHIPKELRDEMGITPQVSYTLHINEEQQCFILKCE
jgi:bifunctional DNA-binding transcriptional regulator/antitoxin component of YhaV-PrlF toxin-antitoxin module